MRIEDNFSAISKSFNAIIEKISWEKLRGWTAPGILVSVAAGLRFYNLSSLGYANHYYAAAVLSMTQSWHNFFFAAAEPGGSASVDKTPLGLWFQVLSSSILGVNSLGILLPQILAGIFSVALVYYLVNRFYGSFTGLLAGLVLAITPVVVAVDRNNTVDSILVLALLLAAWAFIRTVETGQTRYLIFAAILVGLGFNIKMFEAYLPLPAFLLYYLTASTQSFWKKWAKMALVILIILVISGSWMAVVDTTPADQRPYMDNSEKNSAFDLALGYNGMSRLIGIDGKITPNLSDPISLGIGFPGTGTPGIMRLWQLPLSKEASWFLPLGLAGMLLLVFTARPKWPFPSNHQMVVLWGGWLLAGAAFISFGGFIHNYYISIFAVPLAVLTAAGVSELWRLRRINTWLFLSIFVLLTGICLAFQIYTVQSILKTISWLPAVCFLFTAGFVLLLLESLFKQKSWSKPLSTYGLVLVVSSVLLIPAFWSFLTSAHPSENMALPAAYDGHSDGPGKLAGLQVNQALLDFLQKNTGNNKYLFAIPSSMQGSDYILATGRPVLYIGGFTGALEVVTTKQIEELISSGQLRYIYYGSGLVNMVRDEQNLAEWLIDSCKQENGYDEMVSISSAPDGTLNGGSRDIAGASLSRMIHLYDCQGYSPH